MNGILRLAAVAVVLAPGVAPAQDTTGSNRAALRAAIAEVNEGGRDATPRPAFRGDGFFGDGFFIALEPIAHGADDTSRPGERPETSTSWEPQRSDGFIRR